MNTVDEIAVMVFSIVVRTIGMLTCLVTGGVLLFALITLALGGPANGVGMAIIFGPCFLVGLWLLRGAPSIVAYAFPSMK